MNPTVALTTLLRNHGFTDNGIVQVHLKQLMTNPADREAMRNMLIWVAGYAQSPAAPQANIPVRDR